MKQDIGRFSCVFVVFRLSLLFVIFSLFLQCFALHNIPRSPVPRYQTSRRTWRYQPPPQYSRTLSPERLQRFRQIASPRHVADRRQYPDTRRRFRQRDPAGDRRRQTPRAPISEPRRANTRVPRQRVPVSNNGYSPRTTSRYLRNGRFGVVKSQKNILQFRLKKTNNKRVEPVRTLSSVKSQRPLVYNTKPASMPLVSTRTLAPKPSPKLVQRTRNQKNTFVKNSDKIGNFVVDLTQTAPPVSTVKPLVKTKNVPLVLPIKTKAPSAPLVRPIALPKPVIMTQTPKLSASYVKSVPEIPHVVPIPKVNKVPTILVKPPPVPIVERQSKIHEQTKNTDFSPSEPLVRMQSKQSKPLFVLVRNRDGQFANSVIKIEQNQQNDLTNKVVDPPTIVKTNHFKSPVTEEIVLPNPASVSKPPDIKVIAKPAIPETPVIGEQIINLVTETGNSLPGPNIELNSGLQSITNTPVSGVPNVKTAVAESPNLPKANENVNLQEIADFINKIKTGDMNSIGNLPPFLQNVISLSSLDQNKGTVQLQTENMNNVVQPVDLGNQPVDPYQESLNIIQNFANQLKAGNNPLNGNQQLVQRGFPNPSIQPDVIDQTRISPGLMNPFASAGLINNYNIGLQPQFNPMSVRGWDGSSNNVPLVMQQAGITHGSQLSPMMQEMIFGDSIDPPEPTPTAAAIAAAVTGAEVEIEGVPTTVKPRKRKWKRRRRKNRRRNRKQRIRFRPTTETPFIDAIPYSPPSDISSFDRITMAPTTVSATIQTTTTPPLPPTTLPTTTESANDVAMSLAQKLIALVNSGDSAASDILKSLNIDIPSMDSLGSNDAGTPEATGIDANPPNESVDVTPPTETNVEESLSQHLGEQPSAESITEPSGLNLENMDSFQSMQDSFLGDVSLPGDISVPGDSNSESLSLSSFLSDNEIGGVKIEKIMPDQKTSQDENVPTVESVIPNESDILQSMINNDNLNDVVATFEDVATAATTEQVATFDDSATVATTEQPFEPITPSVIVRKKPDRSKDEPLLAGLISMFNFDGPPNIVRKVKPIRTPTPPTTELPSTTTTTTKKPTTKVIIEPPVTNSPIRTIETTTQINNIINTTPATPNIEIPIVPIDTSLGEEVLSVPEEVSNTNMDVLPKLSSKDEQGTKSPLEMLVGLLSELKSAIIPNTVEVPVLSVTTTRPPPPPPSTTTKSPPVTTQTTNVQTTSTTPKPLLVTEAKPQACTPYHPGFQCRGKDFFASIQSTGKWCVDRCRQQGCVTTVCECNCNRQPPQYRLRNAGNQNINRQNNWQNRRQRRRRNRKGRNNRRRKPKPTTKEPPEEIEAEDMISTTTTTEMMTTTDSYNDGFYSDFSQTTPGSYKRNWNNGNRGQHNELLPQLDWASNPNLDVSRYNGNDQPATTAAPYNEWMGPSRPPPSWQGTAWELPPAPVKKNKKKQSSEEEGEGTTRSPVGWTPQPTGWSSGSGNSWRREPNMQRGGWNQPPQNRWNNGPRFNGGSRDTWREPIGNYNNGGGRGSWNDPPMRESGDQWRRNMFGIRRSVDSGFRLRDSWRKSKNNKSSGGEEQEPGET